MLAKNNRKKFAPNHSESCHAARKIFRETVVLGWEMYPFLKSYKGTFESCIAKTHFFREKHFFEISDHLHGAEKPCNQTKIPSSKFAPQYAIKKVPEALTNLKRTI